MKIKITPRFIILCVLVIWGWTTLPNSRPDDEISGAIKKAVGKEVKYEKWEQEERPYKQYVFVIEDYDDEDLLVKIVDAAQNAIDNMQEEENFVNILLMVEIGRGNCESIASISNYYNSGDDYYAYDGFEHLKIYGVEHSGYAGAYRYNDIAAYSKLKDIRNLECVAEIEKSALEQNIVWEDIWPTLDTFAIIETNGRIPDELARGIEVAINDAGNEISFLGEVNSVQEPYWRGYDFVVTYVSENVLYKMAEVEQNQLDNWEEKPYFIKIILLESYDKGLKPIAILYNYYETEDGMVLYGGFKRLEIYGSDYLDQEWADIVFNNAAAYDKLEDIRSIKYSHKIKEANSDPEAVWKNIWENLEECEVIESRLEY